MSGTDVYQALVVVVPLVFWLIVLVTQAFRYPRMLLAMVVWTAAWFGAVTLLPAEPERVARVILTGLFGIGILWPERVGLLSLRGRLAAADRLFRRAAATLRSENPSANGAKALASTLSAGTFPAAGAEWSVAATLFRRGLLQTAGGTPSIAVPEGSYEQAARDFWRAALERDLIGPRFHPDAWDDGVALRGYYEEFHELIPREALVERPMVALGGWDAEAERVIQALRGIPLADPAAREARDALAAAMVDELAVARGDRSADAIARQAASAALTSEKWAALAVREDEAATKRNRLANAAASESGRDRRPLKDNETPEGTAGH